MKLTATIINDTKTTTKTIECSRYWETDSHYGFEDGFGEMEYPKAIVTAYDVNGDNIAMTVDWTR